MLTREDRETELTGMATQPAGRERLLDEFLAAFGYAYVERLRGCKSPVSVIQAILAKEFPPVRLL